MIAETVIVHHNNDVEKFEDGVPGVKSFRYVTRTHPSFLRKEAGLKFGLVDVGTIFRRATVIIEQMCTSSPRSINPFVKTRRYITRLAVMTR